MYSNRRREAPGRGPAQAPPSDIELVKMNIVHELSEEELEKLYMWVDEIPLSRPKKNMNRDFSDGVLTAELIKYFLPRIVDLHNYTPTSNNRLKADNWYHLNRKCFNRLKIEMSHDLVNALCESRQHVIQSVLSFLRDKIDVYLAREMQREKAPRRRQQPQVFDNTADMLPEADQNSRGYVPSAEGFYQDGQYQSPSTRRLYMDYPMTDPLGYHSSPPKSQPASGRNVGNGEMLPKGLLDEREVAIENREQTIQMLQAKIQRLEQLLTLKDLRIEDLSAKLDQLTQPQFHASPRGRMSNRLVNQRGGNAGNRQQQQLSTGRY